MVMQAEAGETAVQATVFYNSTSNEVQVVNVQKLPKATTHQIISYPIQTIPAPVIQIAAKKNTQINQIMASVQQSTTQNTHIDTLTV